MRSSDLPLMFTPDSIFCLARVVKSILTLEVLFTCWTWNYFRNTCFRTKMISSNISSSSSCVFCPRASPSLQAQEPRLQFCRRQIFHHKLRNQGCSFTRDCIVAAASRCFPHPSLSLASEQTLKDLKRSQGHQLGDEESGFG